tara:strand:+ start:1312 stop:1527 length:216 start_codon:yes stop_codon:yes gene_type:complete
MECTKCHTVKNFEDFSYKNESEKIYYLYCDLCRKKAQTIQSKYKEKAKENYNLKKKTEFSSMRMWNIIYLF